MAETLNTYYMSDDNKAFRTVLSIETIEKTKYPFIVEAPDASIKEPKYDWTTYKWIENAQKSQGERLADVETKLAKVDEVAEQNTKTQSMVENMQKSSMQSSQMMGQLGTTIAQLTVAVNTLQKGDAK